MPWIGAPAELLVLKITHPFSPPIGDFPSFAFTHPDMLILVAAGNSGEDAFVGSVGAPATLKNGLSVGASSTTSAAWRDDPYLSGKKLIEDQAEVRGGLARSGDGGIIRMALCAQSAKYYSHTALESFSSAGPAWDGRIKPDLVAPGSLRSALSDGETSTSAGACGNVVMKGTSMATPAVAGLTLLLRQYFREGYLGSGRPQADVWALTPSAALLRAAMIAAADTSRVQRRQLRLEDATSVVPLPLPSEAHPLGDGASFRKVRMKTLSTSPSHRVACRVRFWAVLLCAAIQRPHLLAVHRGRRNTSGPILLHRHVPTDGLPGTQPPRARHRSIDAWPACS